MVSPNDPVRTDVGTTSGMPMTGRGFVSGEETIPVTERHEMLPATGARSYVSWGSVIAGSIVAIAIMILSSSLAYACGMPGYSGGAYGVGSALWSIITAAIAFGAGGYLAAYLSGVGRDQRLSILHGVMAWALGLPLIFVLFNGGTALFGGGGSLVAADVARTSGVNPLPLGNQLTWEHVTGAAWGAFLSCLVGLIAAAIGGGMTLRNLKSLRFGREAPVAR